MTEANRIESNRLTSNTVDLVFVSADGAPLDNCFRANTYSISSPENIEKAPTAKFDRDPALASPLAASR